MTMPGLPQGAGAMPPQPMGVPQPGMPPHQGSPMPPAGAGQMPQGAPGSLPPQGQMPPPGIEMSI